MNLNVIAFRKSGPASGYRCLLASRTPLPSKALESSRFKWPCESLEWFVAIRICVQETSKMACYCGTKLYN